MQLAREEVLNKEWVLRFSLGSNVIVVPIALIKSCVLIIALAVITAFAFNVGQLAATNQVEYAAYMCTEGCYAHAEGGSIVWTCPNTTVPDSLRRINLTR